MNKLIQQQKGSVSLVLIVLLSIGLGASTYFLYESDSQQNALNAQLEKAKRQLRSTQRELKQTHASLDEQESQLLRVNSQRRQLTNEIDRIKQKLSTVQQEKSSAKTQLEQQLKQAQTALKANLVTQEDLSQKESQYHHQISQLNTQSSDLEEKYLSTQQQLSTELSRIDDYSSTIETLEQRLERERTQSTDLEQKYLSTQQQLSTELSRIDQYNSTIETLEQRLAREQLALDDLSDKLAILDKQNAQLHSEKSRLVKQFEDGITIIRLENTILFPSGAAELNPRGIETLNAVAKTLTAFPKHLISIEGHTDHRPIISGLSEKYPSNWELSSARAAYAIRYLSQKGLSAHRFQAVGFGSTRPLQKSEQEHNRRIEILLYPPTQRVTIKPASYPLKNTISFKN